MWLLSTTFAHGANISYDFFDIHNEADDTIECVRLSVGAVKKPVMVWFVGSVSNPVIVDYGAEYDNYKLVLPTNNFDVNTILKDYHLVLFSHPYIPIQESYKNLNAELACCDTSQMNQDACSKFRATSTIEYHVNRNRKVIDFVKKQEWADESKIIIIGHSQGATVAAHLAMNADDIYAVAYISGSPLGRYSYIQENRRKADIGIVTAEKAQENIESNYKDWEDICSDKLFSDNARRTWKSFGRPYLNDMSKITANLFIAYGTEDIRARNCDLIPIILELDQKKNYMMLPMVGRGHNFELVENGKSNFEDMQWQKVIDEFILYLK
ncbi:MAG: acyl-CoA thioester hydrolase/BAAT C-terminal domain-containing protein [bacterium]